MSDSTVKPIPKPPASAATAPLSPGLRQGAKQLQVAGWASLWLQLLVGVIATVMLLFVVFSRNLSDDPSNIQTGFSIVLNAAGIAVLLFGIVTAFRYTRFGKRLVQGTPAQQPAKNTVLQTLHVGQVASLAGMFLTVLSTLLSTGVLLAKLMAQPQGAAIYDPTEIVRVIDVLVIMASVSITAAHYINVVISLWLNHRLKSL